ncbi:alpha/beta hydrolase [Streptomyces sp. NPDC093085]|uniref:alpha/beta hydrolase n=1 Tax=Streptomyces sp. NPDC093085 TaxID=3155068 RepID=UPI00341A8C91
MLNRLAETEKGEAASAALSRLRRLDRNFEYLYTECGLVRTTLNSLAFELSDAQKRLTAALDDASASGFTVHPDGAVSYPSEGKAINGKPYPAGKATSSTVGTPYGPTLGLTSGPPPLAIQSPNHTRAQDIADRIRSALDDAKEADRRGTAALAKLKAAPGLTVDTKTWTDAAGDADAVRAMAHTYLKDNIPLDSPPAERTTWWTHLTQAEREQYLATYPDIIGNLDGIPAEVRDTANRDNLQLLIGELAGRDGEKARAQLEGLRSIDQQLREKPRDGAPPMYLLGIGDQGNGRAIVSFGNPDAARNVAAYVPGLGTKLDGDFAETDIQRARDTAKGARGYDKSSAAIVWLGYDAPQLPAESLINNTDVMFEGRAKAGASSYNQFMAGISSTNQHADPHVTAIGHSYGSFTVGQAAQQKGGIPGADDIILLGSPGTGANSAEDLGVGKNHVYVGAAENDPVTRMPSKRGVLGGYSELLLNVAGGPASGLAGPTGDAVAGHRLSEDQSHNWFGTDPAHKDFGATRFKVADGPVPVVGGQGPTPAHSNYFNPEKDRESADNIARIVAGSNGLTFQEHR